MTYIQNQTTAFIVAIPLLFLISCKTYFPPKVYKNISQNEAYDALIVPGYPFDKDKNNYLMKSRVLWAKYLFDQGICENLIFSGSAVYSPYYESKIMALYAEELGVPKENIFVENQAEHTTENLFFSLKLARKNGLKKVGFATDVYQTTFIAAYLKKLDLEDIDLIPMRFNLIEPCCEIEVASIDYESARKENFISIKDSQSKKQRRDRSNGSAVLSK